MIKRLIAYRANKWRMNKLKERDEVLQSRVNTREFKGRIYITLDGYRIEDVTRCKADEIVAKIATIRRTLTTK